MRSLATRESYAVFKMFMALRRHFNDDKYDYFAYNGKITVAKWDAFQTQPDVYFYALVAKKGDPEGRILATLVNNPRSWITNVIENEEVYIDWKKRTDGLTYRFTSDLSMLQEDYRSNLEVVNGQAPPLLALCLRKKISFETFAILCKLSRVHEAWSEELTDKFVAYPLLQRAIKYEPFLRYDEAKMKAIVKDKFF